MSQPTWAVLQGEVLDVLASMDEESVHCVVVSPPYWGLRSYSDDPKMIGLEPTLGIAIDLDPNSCAQARVRIGRAAADVGAGGDLSIDEDPGAAQIGLF